MTRLFTALIISCISFNLYAQCSYLPQGVISSWQQDRPLWASELSYRPVMSGDYPDQVLTGFEVDRLDQTNFLYEVGVREGDVLISVNDVLVADIEYFSQYLRQLDQEADLILSFSNKPSLRLINTEVAPGLLCNS